MSQTSSGELVSYLHFPPYTPPASEPVGWRMLHQNDLTVVMRVNSLTHNLAGAILYDSITINNPMELLFGIDEPKEVNPNPFKVNPDKRRSKVDLLSIIRQLEFNDPYAGHNAHRPGCIDTRDMCIANCNAWQYHMGSNAIESLPEDTLVFKSLSSIVIRRPEGCQGFTKAIKNTITAENLRSIPAPVGDRRTTEISQFLNVLMKLVKPLFFCCHHHEGSNFLYQPISFVNPPTRTTFSYHIHRPGQFWDIPHPTGADISIHLSLQPQDEAYLYEEYDPSNTENRQAILKSCDAVAGRMCHGAQAMTFHHMTEEDRKKRNAAKRRTRATFKVIRAAIAEVYGIDVTVLNTPDGQRALMLSEYIRPGMVAEMDMDFNDLPPPTRVEDALWRSQWMTPSGQKHTKTENEEQDTPEGFQKGGTVSFFGTDNRRSKSVQIFKVVATYILKSEEMPVWRYARFEFHEDDDGCTACGCKIDSKEEQREKLEKLLLLD